MREFVTEQYLPADRFDVAASHAGAARRAAEQLTSEGRPVHFVRSIFIPDDETCLHLYRAESIDDVRAAATRASLALDRIAEAMSDSGSRQTPACDGPQAPVERSSDG